MNRFQVRRATVEDLPQLRELWLLEDLPADALEPRLAEFHVVDDGEGHVIASVGLATADKHGRLHSEAILLSEQADALRTLLWPRLQTLAKNHGLARLWTSLPAPFWKGTGFKKVTEETLALLPAEFSEDGVTWLTMPLRSEAMSEADLDKQIAVLRAMSLADNQRLQDRAKLMRMLALGLLAVVVGVFAIGVIYWTKLRARMR
ncbi:MAG: hypothetical protein HZA90_03685 [Verrucomicrobia bacterium]|nr:hypothetical protein [Verrucomicrobiota bacterium]